MRKCKLWRCVWDSLGICWILWTTTKASERPTFTGWLTELICDTSMGIWNRRGENQLPAPRSVWDRLGNRSRPGRSDSTDKATNLFISYRNLLRHYATLISIWLSLVNKINISDTDGTKMSNNFSRTKTEETDQYRGPDIYGPIKLNLNLVFWLYTTLRKGLNQIKVLSFELLNMRCSWAVLNKPCNYQGSRKI